MPRAFPDDVDPTSGSRLPLPRREELDAEARQIFDRLMDPKGGSIVGLRGPGGIRLHSPKVSHHTQAINTYLRREADYGGRVRELAILTTARECDSQFEWTAHEPEARREGVPQSVIDVVKFRRSTQGLDPADADIIELGREIFGKKKLSPATYARAKQRFGTRTLVDLVALMGNYAATAALLCAFDMQVDLAQEPLLPPA
jgi:4-carboxymuconolactone decarboxylase